uniref:Putative secreted protein n=1 Tax=Rhipicephalus microplus TaxID=6941 RepID=A0A6M2D9M0_RHIMP
MFCFFFFFFWTRNTSDLFHKSINGEAYTRNQSALRDVLRVSLCDMHLFKNVYIYRKHTTLSVLNHLQYGSLNTLTSRRVLRYQFAGGVVFILAEPLASAWRTRRWA